MTSSQLLISGEGSERGSRYYILSKKLAVKKFAATVKGHWAIENELHWQLEVTFRADHCRIRKGNADGGAEQGEKEKMLGAAERHKRTSGRGDGRRRRALS